MEAGCLGQIQKTKKQLIKLSWWWSLLGEIEPPEPNCKDQLNHVLVITGFPICKNH
jgi:hypothetical protein